MKEFIMQLIKNGRFDNERAFYASKDIRLLECSFDGDADGESALKESSNVIAENCFFNLRYPFWHDKQVALDGCEMTPLCRAALWYSEDISVKRSKMHGIKALRECKNVRIDNSSIKSVEFGWLSKGVKITDSTAEGEYFMFMCEDIELRKVNFSGKYSFQYINNAIFEDCVIDTKDAFWHAKNVTVRNCTVRGEYLAWYSENVTFENCVISGTQPLCYCKGLKLVNCKMEDTDLAFELSEVEANIVNPIISIKNPLSGRIQVPYANEIIVDNEKSTCVIEFTEDARRK